MTSFDDDLRHVGAARAQRSPAALTGWANSSPLGLALRGIGLLLVCGVAAAALTALSG